MEGLSSMHARQVHTCSAPPPISAGFSINIDITKKKTNGQQTFGDALCQLLANWMHVAAAPSSHSLLANGNNLLLLLFTYFHQTTSLAR